MADLDDIEAFGALAALGAIDVLGAFADRGAATPLSVALAMCAK